MTIKDLNKKARDLAEDRELSAVVKVTISSEHAGTLRKLFHEMAENKSYESSEQKTIVLKAGTLEILGHQTNFNEIGASFCDDGVRKSKGDFILYLGANGKAGLTRNQVLAKLAYVFKDKAFNDGIRSRFKTPAGAAKTEPSGSAIMAGRKNDIRVQLSV